MCQVPSLTSGSISWETEKVLEIQRRREWELARQRRVRWDAEGSCATRGRMLETDATGTAKTSLKDGKHERAPRELPLSCLGILAVSSCQCLPSTPFNPVMREKAFSQTSHWAGDPQFLVHSLTLVALTTSLLALLICPQECLPLLHLPL